MLLLLLRQKDFTVQEQMQFYENRSIRKIIFFEKKTNSDITGGYNYNDRKKLYRKIFKHLKFNDEWINFDVNWGLTRSTNTYLFTCLIYY